MDNNQLLQWYEQNHIKQQTIDSFWNYINNYRLEDSNDFYDLFGDFYEPCIEIKAYSVQFTVVFDYGNFIYSNFDIYYNNEYYGIYRLIYDLDGDIVDDMIIWEQLDILKRLKHRFEVMKDFVLEGYNNGISIEKLSLITELNTKVVTEIIEKNK